MLTNKICQVGSNVGVWFSDISIWSCLLVNGREVFNFP